MSIQSQIKTIVLMLSVTNLIFAVLGYNMYLISNVIATTEDDENGGSDEEEDEIDDTNGSDEEEEQQESEGDNDTEDFYQVIIPEGAAYRESISQRYDPAELHVAPGSTVEWTNEDDLIHTVTSGKETGYGLFEHSPDGIFNSGELNEGESFSFQFTEPGSYEYFCVPHPWMTGVVVVE
jgi:plastocyanin